MFLNGFPFFLKINDMLKKSLIGATWNGKGFSISIVEENIEVLKKLGADVFEVKKAKKKKNDTPEQ